MILETNRGIKKMSSIIYDERACHIDTMAKQGKEIERLKAENQHVIWLKHRKEALERENQKLKELLKDCLEVLKLVAGETIDFPRTVDECIDQISQVLGEE